MKTLSKVGFVVTGVLVIGTALVGFGGHSMEPAEHAQWMVKKVTRELELNADQVAKLEVLKERILLAQAQVHDSNEHKSELVVELLSAPVFDRAKVVEVVRTKTDAVLTQAPEVITAFGDFYDSLDSTQKQVVIDHVSERMAHHEHHASW